MVERRGKSKERWGERTRRTRARGKKRRRGRKSGLTQTETRMRMPEDEKATEEKSRRAVTESMHKNKRG